MHSTGGRKLLIIDDDNPVRLSMAAYLEDSGYLVQEAASGEEGLRCFREFGPELVLSDLKMPNMGGMSVLKQIHRESPETPVIVISGAGVMDDVVEALRLGASDYLMKPLVDMEVLDHAVSKALERSDLLAQNRSYREQLERQNKTLSNNLQVFERDQKAGRQVQMHLLPATPVSRSGYQISHYLHPSLYLSGDFIDYAFFQQNRFLGFYLADVSGHGASSAFVTIWLKFLVRQMIRDPDMMPESDPAEPFTVGAGKMLEHINKALLGSRLNNHLTCFMGMVDSKHHKMGYAVGGHLPKPILVNKQGARYLQGKGKPLGLFEGTQWQLYQEDIPIGSSLIVFSDGILEVMEGGNLLEKEQRLLDQINTIGGNMTIDAINETLGIDQLDVSPDDVAVLLVNRER